MPHRSSWSETFQDTPAKEKAHDVQLTSLQAKLVGSSKKLWKIHLDKIAQTYCCRMIEHEQILRIVGDNAEIAALSLKKILDDPPSDLVTRVQEKFR